MKLGQHLSFCDPTLPDDVCATLAALQTHSPPMSVSRVTKILHKDLGAAAAPLITSLEPEPIGAASIGQVHRARSTLTARASRSRPSTRASRARSSPTSGRPRSRASQPGSIRRSMSTPICARRRRVCSTNATTEPRRAITPRSRVTTRSRRHHDPGDPRGVLRCARPHDDVRRGRAPRYVARDESSRRLRATRSAKHSSTSTSDRRCAGTSFPAIRTPETT